MDCSIIICTYNRLDFVKLCLDSISLSGSLEYEIVIVDNYGDSSLEHYCNNYLKAPIIYYYEEKKGLSNARNSGAEIASGEWLLYLDDDVKLGLDFFDELESTILKYNFDCFTGHSIAWHLTSPPKWLPKSFGTKETIAKQTQNLNDDYLIGCVFAIKKQVLEDVGSFPNSLGMNGVEVGYGEETYVGMMLRKKNFKLGVNPNLIVYHAVLPHKYSLLWHLKGAIAFGTASLELHHKKGIRKLRWKKIKLFGKQLILCPLRIVIEKEFYTENAVIELLSPLLFIYGTFKITA